MQYLALRLKTKFSSWNKKLNWHIQCTRKFSLLRNIHALFSTWKYMNEAKKGSINSTIQHTNQKILQMKSESTQFVYVTPKIRSALHYVLCTLLHSEYWHSLHEQNTRQFWNYEAQQWRKMCSVSPFINHVLSTYAVKRINTICWMDNCNSIFILPISAKDRRVCTYTYTLLPNTW